MRFPYKPSGVFRFSPPAHPKWRETQTPSMRFPDSRTGSVSPSSSRTTLPTVHCSPRQSLSSVNSGSQLPSTVAHPAGSPTPTSSLRRNSSGRRKPTPRETRPRRSACDAERAGSPTGRSTLRPAAPTATTRIERPERGPATRSRRTSEEHGGSAAKPVAAGCCSTDAVTACSASITAPLAARPASDGPPGSPAREAPLPLC
jgi:hypothetical protein